MYHDLRFKALERQERTSRDPRIGPGTALFVSVYSLFGVSFVVANWPNSLQLADAVIAAASSRPSFISTAELETYFLTDGVPIPDFPGSNLRDELTRYYRSRCRRKSSWMQWRVESFGFQVVRDYSLSWRWVSWSRANKDSSVDWINLSRCTARRANAPSPLPLLKNLWSLIDSVHNSLQHLQSILVHLDLTQVGDLDDSPYALDHFVLLGVRADSILVDLINLMHVWLQKDRNQVGIWTEKEEDPLLISMRKESELRVRKCLKLSAWAVFLSFLPSVVSPWLTRLPIIQLLRSTLPLVSRQALGSCQFDRSFSLLCVVILTLLSFRLFLRSIWWCNSRSYQTGQIGLYNVLDLPEVHPPKNTRLLNLN